MLFAIEVKDKPNSLDLRLGTRPAHLEYLKSLGEKLVLAGPFLDENDKPNGSLVVVKVDGLAAAKEIAAADPYALAGLFENVSVRQWVWSLNAPEGL